MKKPIAIILAAIMMFALCACGNTATDSSDSGPTYVFTFGTVDTDEHPSTMSAKKLGEILNEKAPGKWQINVHPNSTLGGAAELVESIQMGNVDMACPATSFLANYVPSIGVLDLPYMFTNTSEAYPICSMSEKAAYYSQDVVDRRMALIVEVITDEGISGWGEGFCSGQNPLILKAIVDNAYTPRLIGRDPFDNDVIYETLYNMSRSYGQSGSAIIALSAIDVALWDIKGKALNMPIYKLLGGAYRDGVEPYASGPCRIEGEVYPDAAVEQAKQYVKQGYKAMKFKIGFGVNEDVKLIHAVREAIGPDIRIMVDANCAYDVSKAKRILFDTADADLYWFEEPISPENRTGYAELKNLTKTYLAAGEQEYSKYHYKEWLEARSVDILQPDLCVMGGFTEGKKVLALAQAYMIQLVPHMWGTGIGVAAGLQFIANIPATPLALFPDEPMIEYDLSENLLRDTLIGKTIKIENGTVKIPHGSGLGIKVDRNVIERFLMK